MKYYKKSLLLVLVPALIVLHVFYPRELRLRFLKSYYFPGVSEFNGAFVDYITSDSVKRNWERTWNITLGNVNFDSNFIYISNHRIKGAKYDKWLKYRLSKEMHFGKFEFEPGRGDSIFEYKCERVLVKNGD
jgi:hypothetical protein